MRTQFKRVRNRTCFNIKVGKDQIKILTFKKLSLGLRYSSSSVMTSIKRKEVRTKCQYLHLKILPALDSAMLERPSKDAPGALQHGFDYQSTAFQVLATVGLEASHFLPGMVSAHNKIQNIQLQFLRWQTNQLSQKDQNINSVHLYFPGL